MRFAFLLVVLFSSLALRADEWSSNIYYHVVTNGLTLVTGTPPNVNVCPVGSRYRVSSNTYEICGVDLAWAQECCGERLCAPSNTAAKTKWNFEFNPNLHRTKIIEVSDNIEKCYQSKSWIKNEGGITDSLFDNIGDIADLFPNAFYTQYPGSYDYSESKRMVSQYGKICYRFITTYCYGWMSSLKTFVVRKYDFYPFDANAFTRSVIVNSNGYQNVASYDTLVYRHAVQLQSSYNAYTMPEPVWDQRAELKYEINRSAIPPHIDPPGVDGWSIWCNSNYAKSDIRWYLLFKVSRTTLTLEEESPTETTNKYVLMNVSDFGYGKGDGFNLKYLSWCKDAILSMSGMADDVEFTNYTPTEWNTIKWILYQYGPGGQYIQTGYAEDSFEIRLVKIFPVATLRDHADLYRY